MLNSIDKTLLRVTPIDFYEKPSVYDSNTTLYGGGGKLGIEKCEKSAIRSNNYGNDCIYTIGYFDNNFSSTMVEFQATKD